MNLKQEIEIERPRERDRERDSGSPESVPNHYFAQVFKRIFLYNGLGYGVPRMHPRKRGNAVV